MLRSLCVSSLPRMQVDPRTPSPRFPRQGQTGTTGHRNDRDSHVTSNSAAGCSKPPASSPTTRIAVLVDFMGKVITLSRLVVASAELHLACSFVAWLSVLMCPPRLSTGDRGLFEPLTRACVRGLLCFLVVCCASCSRCACLCAHLWGGKRSFAREEQIWYVCVPCKRCTAGCLGTKRKWHCSGAFRSHDIIYGLSEALWTLAISPECLKVVKR